MATINTGVKALRKIQLGKETTAKTNVPATTVWRGMGLLEYDDEVVRVDEEVGIALPTNRWYKPKEGALVTFDPEVATYQQLPYIFEAGVAAEVATQDGTGSGYIYAYAMPSTAMNTLNTYSIEGGDNVQARETSGAFVESFKISGTAAEGVMMEASWRGDKVEKTTFTGALTVPALIPGDHITFGGSNLYIDAVSGTIGTTEISNTLLSFELDVSTGYKAKWTNQGLDYDFIYWDRGSYSATLKLVFEHNTAGSGQMDLFDALTPRLFRLRFDGYAPSSVTGATYPLITFIIDAAGTYMSNPTMSDVDGNDTWEMEVDVTYDLTASQGLSFIVVNELSALP